MQWTWSESMALVMSMIQTAIKFMRASQATICEHSAALQSQKPVRYRHRRSLLFSPNKACEEVPTATSEPSLALSFEALSE